MTFVLKTSNDFISSKALRKVSGGKDYKTLLQEYVQRDGDKHIVYRLLSESGPDHAKSFHMVVEINGVTYEAGSGKSKKIAEQHAAQLTLEKLMADK